MRSEVKEKVLEKDEYPKLMKASSGVFLVTKKSKEGYYTGTRIKSFLASAPIGEYCDLYCGLEDFHGSVTLFSE